MSLSLIALAREAEALAFHTNAAKLLAPFAPDAAAQHLKNARGAHQQITELFAAADEARKQAMAIKEDAA